MRGEISILTSHFSLNFVNLFRHGKIKFRNSAAVVCGQIYFGKAPTESYVGMMVVLFGDCADLVDKR